MCGRFVIAHPAEETARLFNAAPANDLPHTPNFNICPTDRVAVVTGGPQRRLRPMRWGFLPHWYKTPGDRPLLINARAETLATSRAFGRAAREGRCLIPASGFYEWTKDAAGNRLPWYIRPESGEPMAFAGIWQDWGTGEDRISTCAIVTTTANRRIADIHHRMPVIIAAADHGLWLGESGSGAARLMAPPRDDLLTCHRVDPAVNSNRARGADLIQPMPA